MRHSKDSEIIRDARDSISDPDVWTREQWCVKDTRYSDNGDEGDTTYQMCAEGAIFDAMGLVDWFGLPNLSDSIDAANLLSDHPQARRIFKELQVSAAELMPDVVKYQNSRREYRNGELVERQLLPGDRGYIAPEDIPIHEFNDHHVVKHEDVLAIFDKTAARLEEQGR